MMTRRATFAIAHLQLRLLAVNRLLRAAVAARAARSALLDRPDLAAVCVTDRQVAVLLDEVDGVAPGEAPRASTVAQVPAEPGHTCGDELPGVTAGGIPLDLAGAEAALREAAAAAGERLPLDELAERFGLDHAAVDALLLVAAPEIDAAYERIFAYVLDDVARRLPCVELLATVGCSDPIGRLHRRRWLGPAGPLRRCHLVEPVGASPTDGRQELRLVAGLLDFLLGTPLDLAAIAGDDARPPLPDLARRDPGVDAEHLARVGAALACGEVDLVGVWGGGYAGVVAALGERTGRPVRLLDAATLPPDRRSARATVRDALRTAAATTALLWVRLAGDDGLEPAVEDALADELAGSTVPACVTGPAPWRPPVLLAARAWLELEPGRPTHSQRLAMWSAAIPEIDAAARARLAARYRLDGQDLAAVASLARTETATANGHGPEPCVALERAAAAVAQRRVPRLARIERPTRCADELVLPSGEHRQVLEVAAFFEAWPRVAEHWGFGAAAGARGVKALFTGEPGTGKTLAAEVIASRLGLGLLKTDVSRLVSKWVGETEKNLDAAFREAEASNAVLFFDEADALFGRRGQIDHGSDRWANLEVGFLLQRLDAFDGLAVLASNLRENIDPAFMRRFTIVVHFPRPDRADRLRLWRTAFPPAAPLDAEVDLDALAALDLTGAGIVGAARTAALLAADAGQDRITMAHVVRGLARQFQREARVLRPSELGRHAPLLDDDGHG